MRALELDPVEAPGDTALGDRPRTERTISAISRSSTSFGTSRNSGSATGDGAQTGRREYIPEDWPPLWLIWAKIGAPSAWTASVIRR